MRNCYIFNAVAIIQLLTKIFFSSSYNKKSKLGKVTLPSYNYFILYSFS